ncbi:MAG: DMT family transporter [Bacteroides sp.]|nr:DMT family transporter [Bacteroides sp.]MCM1550978.1 DMT family transporter [Clostridium sp.]
MWGIIIALISGALMSVQGVFNTGVTKQTGTWLTNSWVQLTGFLVCLAVWLFKERQDNTIASLFQIDHKYMLLGGVIGAFITLTVILSMDHLGPAQAVLLIVVSQVVVAYLIELFGWFAVEKVGFQWSKLVGVIVAIAGIIIFKWK